MPETGISREKLTAEREPTADELAQWERVLDYSDDISENINEIKRLSEAGRVLSFFLDANGLLPGVAKKLENLKNRFNQTFAESANIVTLLQDVKDQYLGLRWTGEDFDIIDPNPETTDGLGIAFVPIAIGVGVVALAGLIGRLIYLEQETDEIRNDYNDLLTKTDNTLCSDPNSQTCKSWKKTKDAQTIEVKKTFMERVGESASSVVGSGLGIVAIAVLAMFLLRKK